MVPEFIIYLNKLEFQIVLFYENRQRYDYLFYTLHECIQYSIIKQGKFWETRTNLEQMTTSLKTILVPLEGIKAKCSYVLATRSKAEAKPAFRFLDKKLAVYHIVGFVNWKRKVKTCLSDNQTA